MKIRASSTSFSLLLGLLCLGPGCPEGRGKLGSRFGTLQGRGGSKAWEPLTLQSLQFSLPPGWEGNRLETGGRGGQKPSRHSLAAPNPCTSPQPTHMPPLIHTDSTWLLKPWACRLRTSPSSSISFPSKHSSPYREMEGSEKCWGPRVWRKGAAVGVPAPDSGPR